MDTNNDMNNDTRHITHHTGEPTTRDEIGEAAGGISGVVAGAAIGSLGGPVGTVIGGIAGAVGGWWAGRAVSEATKHYTHSDDDFYRHHYEGSVNRLADQSYEQVRPAYQVGHIAARNPEYQGKSFDQVEGDLRKGWETGTSAVEGAANQTAHGISRGWDTVRGYARDAYTRSAATVEQEMDRDTAQTPARSDEVFDKVDVNHRPLDSQ